MFRSTYSGEADPPNFNVKDKETLVQILGLYKFCVTFEFLETCYLKAQTDRKPDQTDSLTNNFYFRPGS